MPIEIHVATVKRIMRCLQGTLEFGILFEQGIANNLQLLGWTDSDYATNKDDRKNTPDYVFKIGFGAIS